MRIFNIGYEGTNIRDFIATLNAAKVRKLADVRALPLSRKRGFSKSSLREALAAEGIAYLPFRDLGDPKAGRDAARAGRLAQFRAIYGDHLQSQAAQLALKVLAREAQDDATCLMCFERDPEHCHRTIILKAIGGFEIVNLFPASGERLDGPREGARRGARESTSAAQQEVW